MRNNCISGKNRGVASLPGGQRINTGPTVTSCCHCSEKFLSDVKKIFLTWVVKCYLRPIVTYH